MPTENELRERVEGIIEGIPENTGFIITHWPTKRVLASRAVPEPVEIGKHFATLNVLDVPATLPPLEGPPPIWRGEEPRSGGIPGGAP